MESYDGPVLDNHLHLDPRGEGPACMKEFRKAGGTHVFVVHKPYQSLHVTKADDFAGSFAITLELARRVNEETDVRAFTAAGPYPVEYIHLEKRLGAAEAEAAMMKGMEIAAKLAEEGAIQAIGEIGRPHFPVEPEVLEASNRILKRGMELAAQAGCPVVLHTESTTPETCLELGRMADDAGLPRDKVVKHFSPPLVTPDLNAGLFPSVLASTGSVTEAARQGLRFLMETDYLDDPARPGAVMGVKTIPKRTHMLLEKGLVSPEDMWTIHDANPRKVYGVDMDL